MKRRGRKRGGLWQWWGLGVLVLLITAWWTMNVGPVVLLVLSVLVTSWALFQAPVWCGADNREEGTFCRKNSSGLLVGCTLRQHKWQKFKALFVQRRWQQFTNGLWENNAARLATVSGMIGIVSAVASPFSALFS
jgi:hypothetical protein